MRVASFAVAHRLPGTFGRGRRRAWFSALAVAALFASAGCGGDSLLAPGIPAPPATAQAPITTASGLTYQDFVVGTGARADSGAVVTVHYTGWLTDGTQFDSSRDRGTPYQFVVSRGAVIAGWDEGCRGMHVGGQRRLTIPPNLAYGAAGAGGVIPPNATLIFDIELLGVAGAAPPS